MMDTRKAALHTIAGCPGGLNCKYCRKRPTGRGGRKRKAAVKRLTTRTARHRDEANVRKDVEVSQ